MKNQLWTAVMLGMMLAFSGAQATRAVETLDVLQTVNEYCDKGADDTGIHGVTVKCTFSCKANSNISVEVESEDNDAPVEGDAACGGADTSCNAIEFCSNDSLTQHKTLSTSESTTGTCKGRSDEAFDSYVHIECSAEPQQTGPGPDDVEEKLDWCPVGVYPSPPYPKVCTKGSESPCQPFVPGKLDGVAVGGASIDAQRCEIAVPGPPVPRVLVAMLGDKGFALFCDEDCTALAF